MAGKQELGPLQREWIRALRSGEYRQTCGKLIGITDDGEEYGRCCLGVACAVAEKAGHPVKNHKGTGVVCVNGFDSVLPPSIRSFLKFRDTEGDLGGHYLRQQRCLTSANDSGATFAEIADFVESNPSAVFTGPA